MISTLVLGSFGIFFTIGVIATDISSNYQNALDILDFYDEDGPYDTDSSYFYEGNTLIRPEDLGENGFLHPIILWADGTFALPIFYRGTLKHMASHGFVVIGPNDMFTGQGDTVFEALDLLLEENNDPSSEFYQKLDTDKICVMGHSQGGATSVKVGEDDRITCTITIQPWAAIYDDASKQNGPMFLIASDEDDVCPPESNSDIIFASASTPTVYGILEGVGHLSTLGDMGAMTKYMTAWCYTHLYEDDDARAVFYGEDALIYQDAEWDWQTKNM